MFHWQVKVSRRQLQQESFSRIMDSHLMWCTQGLLYRTSKHKYSPLWQSIRSIRSSSLSFIHFTWTNLTVKFFNPLALVFCIIFPHLEQIRLNSTTLHLIPAFFLPILSSPVSSSFSHLLYNTSALNNFFSSPLSCLATCLISWLSRAIETAWLVLDELDSLWLPIIKTWRLNERYLYSKLFDIFHNIYQH